MKKSFDRARMKFMRKHRKGWNSTKRMLEQLNCSQVLDYFAPKGESFDVNGFRCSQAKELPPIEKPFWECDEFWKEVDSVIGEKK